MPSRTLVHLVGPFVAVVGTVAACGSDAPELSADAERGQQVAQEWGCASCHTSNGETSAGPTWDDIWSTDVPLTDGRTVTVDRDYITRSIREPDADVVEGFDPVMPTLNLSDEQIADIEAYIQALGSG